jgi:3-isopropylmalate dehydrogenase
MLLDWMATEHKQPKLSEAANCISDAVELALATPATRTRDLGGSLGTEAFVNVVLAAVRQ